MSDENQNNPIDEFAEFLKISIPSQLKGKDVGTLSTTFGGYLVPSNIQAMVLDSDNYIIIPFDDVDGMHYGDIYKHENRWVTLTAPFINSVIGRIIK